MFLKRSSLLALALMTLLTSPSSANMVSPLDCEGYWASGTQDTSSAHPLTFLEQLREQGQTETLQIIEMMISNPRFNPAGLNLRTLMELRVWQRISLTSDQDQELVLAWIRQFRDQDQLDRSERQDVEVATVRPGFRMVFHPLLMVTQDHSIVHLMETAVTEAMWLTVMGSPPAKMVSDAWPEYFEDRFRPLVHFSSDEMLEFIEKLNEMAKDSNSPLHKMLEGHHPGDRYDIPTDSMISSITGTLFRDYADIFMTELAGMSPTMSIREAIDPYAWISTNSQSLGPPMPVGRKFPFEIDGHDFFDLTGNVEEVVKNRDPRFGTVSFKHWGGHLLSSALHFRARLPHQVPAFVSLTSKDSFTGARNKGIRLIRLRKWRSHGE